MTNIKFGGVSLYFFKEYNGVLRLKSWRLIALDYIMPLGLCLCRIPCLKYNSFFHICLENIYIPINISLVLIYFRVIHSYIFPSYVLLYPENVS